MKTRALRSLSHESQMLAAHSGLTLGFDVLFGASSWA
jgi:hypothetical protein